MFNNNPSLITLLEVHSKLRSLSPGQQMSSFSICKYKLGQLYRHKESTIYFYIFIGDSWKLVIDSVSKSLTKSEYHVISLETIAMVLCQQLLKHFEISIDTPILFCENTYVMHIHFASNISFWPLLSWKIQTYIYL